MTPCALNREKHELHSLSVLKWKW